MSLEQQISELNNTIKALTVALGSALAATQIATSAPAADAAAPAPAPKADKPAKVEKKAEAPAPTPAPAAAPEVKWAEVLAAVKEVNSSTKDGCGRAGVTAILEKFGKAGDKVPALEAVGKHAEILAFAKGLLEGNAAGGEDDLGI